MPARIHVGRPTPWGNVAKVVGPDLDQKWWVHAHPFDDDPCGFQSEYDARQEAVTQFRTRFQCDIALMEQARMVLHGKDLACFCSLEMPCHAEVLLEIASAPRSAL